MLRCGIKVEQLLYFRAVGRRMEYDDWEREDLTQVLDSLRKKRWCFSTGTHFTNLKGVLLANMFHAWPVTRIA
jgi:hypothetical protein